MLNKTQEELPSASDIDKVDDIELQEIVENASRSIENLNQQVQEEPTEDLPSMAHVRTPRSGQTTQEHKRFTKS